MTFEEWWKRNHPDLTQVRDRREYTFVYVMCKQAWFGALASLADQTASESDEEEYLP